MPEKTLSAVKTGQMYSVETGQMSAVETGQMSAAETGQTSAVETRQVSSVARATIWLVSTHNNDDVSEVSIVAMLKSQIGGLARNRRKWSEMGPEWLPGPENRSP